MKIAEIIGKHFKGSEGTWYGPMRSIDVLSKPIEEALVTAQVSTFASDECGNYFVVTAQGIAFWDHETGDIESLSSTTEEFIANLHAQGPTVSLEPGQVISSWADPTFKPEFD